MLRGDELDDVDAVLATPAGPAFLHQKICTGTLDDLPRPKITPPQVLERLMRHIGTR